MRLFQALGKKLRTPLSGRVERLVRGLQRTAGRTNGPADVFALIRLMCQTVGVHDEVVASLTHLRKNKLLHFLLQRI